jgi:two-component system sensor histidine kinase AlgZ
VHPLLTNPRKLALYLAAWIPLAALLAGLLVSAGDFTWLTAAEFAVPLSVVFAFVSLSAWYVCQAVPLQKSRFLYLLLAGNVAAAASSVICAGPIAWALAVALGLETPYLRHRAVLFGAGYLFFNLALAFHYLLIALQTSRQAQEREMELRILAREAELRALKAQIDPHFLFNSLHSISALTACDPVRAREMCVQLSDFLRRSLGMGNRERIPLAEEVALARSFLAVQRVRFGARLRVEEEIGEACETCLIPPLLLQPLVENAVTHGVATLVDGGSIHIEARRSGERVAIRVENSFDRDASKRPFGGVGLANVRKRLEVCYGSAASVEAGTTGDRFRVEVVLPAETESKG